MKCHRVGLPLHFSHNLSMMSQTSTNTTTTTTGAPSQWTCSCQLYPFQEKVVQWAETKNNLILGLDMGLGKTVISLSMLAKHQEMIQQALVVLPLPILEQWRQCFLRMTNIGASNVVVFQGPGRHSIDLSRPKVVLTTYDVIRYDMALQEKTNQPSVLYQARDQFQLAIFDEAHKLRNNKTATYQTCYSLTKDIPCKWLLTGTPIHNRYSDYTSLCTFVGVSSDAKTKAEVYYRLTKAEANLQLPEKVITEDHLQADELTRHEYQEIFRETKKLFHQKQEGDGSISFGSILTKILRLRQCCNHPDAYLDDEAYHEPSNRHGTYLSAKMAKILELVTQAPKEDKIIIFSQWEHSLRILTDILQEHGHTSLLYSGRLDQGARTTVLHQFKTRPTRILLLTLTSGGVGLDMSYANHVILMDHWWNLALEEQAIDRIYRIGQTKKVYVHRLFVLNTIEEWMRKMKEEKGKVMDKFHLEGETYEPDHGTLNTMLQSYLR
jgi:SNF2 family DNA or RNA helicase